MLHWACLFSINWQITVTMQATGFDSVNIQKLYIQYAELSRNYNYGNWNLFHIWLTPWAVWLIHVCVLITFPLAFKQVADSAAELDFAEVEVFHVRGIINNRCSMVNTCAYIQVHTHSTHTHTRSPHVVCDDTDLWSLAQVIILSWPRWGEVVTKVTVHLWGWATVTGGWTVAAETAGKS